MFVSKRIFKDVSGPDYSFTFKQEEQPCFYDKYHYHPEYEFTYIERGSGIRYVGDHLESFGPGDLILLGPNLSHLWKCDPHYYQEKHPQACCSYVLHFPRELLEPLLSIPEMMHVRNLLDNSKQGLKPGEDQKAAILEVFRKLPEQSQAERFLSLLQLLHLMASSENLQLLSQSWVSDGQEEEASERLNMVYNHLLQHLHEKISLEEVATMAHMSPTSFCRFFKQKTGKRFTEALQEIRIRHACRLLGEGQEKIAQIALASGFTNLSHFNKQFRLITGKTPKEFKGR